jgi:hypothetical protein
MYSSVWILLYVIAFPLWIGRQLLAEKGQGRQVAYSVGFLANDYKEGAPGMVWELEEMVRKLLLSVIGAFWRCVCVQCALLRSSSIY